MTLLQSLFLGALQGVAEFLPVSSSGHLVLARQVLKVGAVPALFDVILHVATLLVVLVVFRSLILRLLGTLGRFLARRSRPEDNTDLRLIVLVLVSTFFTALIGFGLETLDMETRPKMVSLLFLVTAGLLITTRFTGGKREYPDLKLKDGVAMGIAQGLGVLPGISRSGITIAAALGLKMDRSRAGEFSFLLSIPAVAGALILELKDFGELAGTVSPGVLLGGFLASALVGFLSLTMLLKLLRQGRLYLFAIYLIPLGTAGIFLL